MFAYALAGHLKIGTVKELLSRIDEREFQEWKIYYGINPFGEVRGDIQAALIASTIANVNSKKRFKLDDFMLRFKTRKKEQTPEQQKQLLKAFCSLWDNPKMRKTNVNCFNTIS